MTSQLKQQLQRHLHYLQQDKQNSYLLLTISSCYHQLNQLTIAEDYLNQAKTISGKPFYLQQGLLHRDKGELRLAIEALTQALAEEDSPNHRYHLAYCLYLHHDFAKALTILSTANDNDTQLLQAKLYQQLQQSDKAMAILEQLVTTDCHNADVKGLLSLLYFDANQIEQAQHFCQQALALNHNQLDAKIVHLLLKTLDNNASISELKTQLDSTPNECRLWFALGSVAMQEMDYLAANDAFLKAIAIWPDFYEALVYSGWCYLLQNKSENAEQAWQQAVHLDANKAEGFAGLALINALQGKELMAKQYLATSRERDAQCFLITLTEIILLNHHNPEQAALLLQTMAPELTQPMNQLRIQLKAKASDVIH